MTPTQRRICRSQRAALESLADGQIRYDQREALEQHAATCAICRSELEAHLALRAALDLAQDTAVRSADNEAFIDAIWERVDATPRVPASRWFTKERRTHVSPPRLLATVVMAAAAIALIVLWPEIDGETATPDRQIASAEPEREPKAGLDAPEDEHRPAEVAAAPRADEEARIEIEIDRRPLDLDAFDALLAPRVTELVANAPFAIRRDTAAQSSVSIGFTSVAASANTRSAGPKNRQSRSWLWIAWLKSAPPASRAQVPRQGAAA